MRALFLLILTTVFVFVLAQPSYGQNTTIVRSTSGNQVREVVINHRGQDTTTDSDGDGVSDARERELGSNPNLLDSDGDGLIDSLEFQYGSNPAVADASIDILYVPKILDAPSGYTHVEPTGMNDVGGVTGVVFNDSPTSASIWKAVRWTGSTAEIAPGSLGWAYGTAINNTGHVAGYSDNGALDWAGSSVSAIYWNYYNLTSYETVEAWDINAAGEIVGRTWWYQGFIKSPGSSLAELFKVPLGYDGWETWAINDDGRVVGSMRGRDKPQRAAFWAGKTDVATVLELPLQDARDISNSGRIVGTGYDNGNRAYHRAINGTIVELPAPVGYTSKVTAVNNSGEVLGYGYIQSQPPKEIIWRPDSTGGWMLVDLASHITDPVVAATFEAGWGPGALNNLGQICGYYTDIDGNHRGVVLNPVIPPRLLVDANRDGQIDPASLDATTQAAQPFRFWLNDDDDDGDEANQGGVTGNSDEPGRLSGWFEFDGRTPDHAHAGVDGRCDLIDFFPVYLDLKQLLTVLPPDSSLQYKFKQEDEALNFVYTDLTRETAFDYLTKEVATYGNGFNKLPHEAETVAISDEGVALSTAFLDKIKNGTSKGVLLFEATKVSAKPLVLSVEKADGTVITEVKLHLKIGEVEKMYRWINLRAEAGQGETRATSTAEPENYPDSTTNGKMFVFVHGYNVNERQSRAWNAEAFKRLYQSGSRAMFTAVTWHGDHSQIPLIGISPDYWENISNAFATAPSLAAAVNVLPGSIKVIAGHSMGNMVVTSAIKDHGMNAYRYFMLNAAVALEAYDTSAMSIGAMTHQDWSVYNDQLWATEWHQLFDTGDGRRALTWRDRFGDLRNAINFYSSGEDVLNNNDAASGGTPGQVPDVGTEYSWVLQEMVKGTQHFGAVLTFDSQGGWGFNSAWDIAETVSNPGPHGSTTTTTYRRQTPAEANLLLSAPEQLKTKPFFRRFEDARLIGASGSAAAAEYLTRATALGTAIPALSFAAGRNPVPRFSLDQRNIDLVNLQDGWPQARLADPTKRITPTLGSWFHSDLKNVAYRYNYLMWENLVQKGALK